jgi:exodeoxyribonuclease V beta subunit
VLVRTGAEGKLVQQELARLAIASVYLSNRESVLAQVEAQEILLICTPARTRAMSEACGRRSPPACSIWMPGRSTRWPRTSGPGRARCRSLWSTARSGIATGAGHAAGPDARAQPRRLPAGEPLRERRLTNFLHLGELLQQASGELDGNMPCCAGSGRR